MEYKKSLGIIKEAIEAYIQQFKKQQESMLETMGEIDKDIAFALENKDLEHAAFLQRIFDELQEVANGTNPLSYKQLSYVIALINEKIKEGDNGEEHKATTEA